MEYTYTGFENFMTAKHLQEGETCKIIGIGNSMTPVLKSRQPVIAVPVTADTVLKKKDIVLSKVNGHFYLHFIHAIKNNDQFLIGNNHGHMNGWVSRNKVYGVVREILQ